MRHNRFFRKLGSLFPAYVLWTFAAMAASQIVCYYLTRLFLPHMTLHLLTGPLDARIPFVPAWVTVYLLSFPFWIGTGLAVLTESKSHACRLGPAYVLAMAVSTVIFLVYPGTLERPEVTGSGVFQWLMRLVYRLDPPNNLCPSLHVLVTYFCWRGTLGCRKIPGWYKVFSLAFTVLVCCSVVLVKQHALVDIPAGILVGEAALQCARILRLERIPYALERNYTGE